jgi:SAM-dependent methyltransferase
MDWVEEFYRCQNEWFGIYLVDVEDAHRERAELINKMTDLLPKSILELGAGGGQTAISLAELGHQVTMVELLEESTNHAKRLASEMEVNLEVVQGDFYAVELDQTFDLICYFDSFGIGTDEDQRRLLKRIHSWLKPNGTVIIEIGATWYWAGIANGRSIDLGACIRQYAFDATNSRLIDSWWRKDDPETIVNQSLRCYTPVDIKMLLEGTGLKMNAIEAGGKVDYDKLEFIKKVPLQEAMTYYIKLETI